jgi:hypothetical protein
MQEMNFAEEEDEEQERNIYNTSSNVPAKI